MPFPIQTVWREQPYHIRECDFCLTNVKGFSAKSKHGIEYLNLPLAAQQSLVTVSPFQSPQVIGPLMMKARTASQTTGMELQPV
jgi:hypothetical protein